MAAKRVRESGLESLPGSVISGSILTRLPLWEAVRTSVLSRAWRHRWKSMPRLEFSEKSFPDNGEDAEAYWRRVVKAVDRALLLHVGPVRKFILDDVIWSCPDIDSWIWVLSRKGVKKIVLRFWQDDEYRLPSCLFDCEELTYLSLTDCMLRLPPGFKGFRYLKTLELCYSACSSHELRRLVSSCPRLKYLLLEGIVGCDDLRLSAPNLRRLLFSDVAIKHLTLENSPLLEYLCAGPFSTEDDGNLNGKDGANNLVRLFTPLPCLEELDISSDFLQHLSMGNIPERLPIPLYHLTDIHVQVRLTDLKDIMVALCLFRSCPALETLRVDQSGDLSVAVPVSDFWQAREGLNCSFDHLSIMVLANISGVGPEMAFAEFMLANSPVLEKLTIVFSEGIWNDDHKVRMVTKEFLSFPRASKEARILLLD